MRTLATTSISALALAATLFFLPSSNPAPATGPSTDATSSSKKAVGTYYQSFTLPGLGTFRILLSLNEGGTLSGTDGNDPGNDPAAHGIWRSIGGGQVEICFLSLDYDASGTLVQVARGNLISNGTTDNPLASSGGTFDFFDPSVDPTDPNAVPLFSADFTATASRLDFP